MEKIGREALNFMNMESSQLSSILSTEEKPIRLFGKEFGGGGHSNNIRTTTNMSESIDSNPFHDEPKTNMVIPTNYTAKESHIGKNDEMRRKYECHYCFRSFPTSQALGGHQNAHKKERHNAKLAHIQSSVVHEKNIYGITNRHRLGEAAAATRTHHHSTWTNINNKTPPRFYGNGHHVNVISPLAFWHQNNNSASSSSSSHNLVFPNDEKKEEVQDHVSLDLHL